MANKNIKSLKAEYEKAIKKEQALSSLMLANLVKYKQAKAAGNEKAIAKHTKIAGQLSPKKKTASEIANKSYQAYEDAISGLHADAELQIDEAAPRMKINKKTVTIGYLRNELQKIETMSKINDPAYSRYKNDFQKAYKGLLALSNGIRRHATDLWQGIGESKLNEVRKLVRNAIIQEAGVFDTPDTATTNDGGAEDPKSNMAVKKFDMILKGKPGWEKTKEIASKLSDVKQADFIEYLMNDLAASEMARKKLKLRL
tara:strand:- start:691 stop:1461 length:771 start_codon:yes stop_codon:yes gene_type:complete